MHAYRKYTGFVRTQCCIIYRVEPKRAVWDNAFFCCSWIFQERRTVWLALICNWLVMVISRTVGFVALVSTLLCSVPMCFRI